MPKGGRKKGNIRPGRGRLVDAVEEEHSDTISVVSSNDDASIGDGSICGDPEVDESAQAELFEDKVGQAIDGASDKSATTRTNSILSLCSAFSKKYVPDVIDTRRMTISDLIEKSMKKGKSAEVAAAADLSMLLCLQLQEVSELEQLYRELKHVLTTLVADNAAAPTARAKCCAALSFICFLSNAEPEEVHAVLVLLESVFRGSYHRGDGTAASPPADHLPLHTAALQAWSLLVTAVSHNALLKLADSLLPRLLELLDSPDVDLRIAAGEAIVLVYELVWSVDEAYTGDDLDELCTKLKQLATDSAKSRTKRDRKQQRGTFRDILRTFEEDEYPYDQVKFGKEVLVIDTWNKKRLYDTISSLLRSGTNVHLKENELLRSLLGLGAPLVTSGQPQQKVSKLDRMYMLNEATKNRQQARSRVRDKRVAMFD